MASVSTKTESTWLLGGDLQINRLGYGAMQLTGTGVFGEVADRENAKKVLQAAVSGGVNFIDTADAYGPHLNESLIAEALHPYANGVVIATKGGFTRPGPNKWVPNGRPDFIKENIDGSLKRLKLEQIPLWQLHRIDPKVPVEETLGVVKEAVQAGKIKHVGLSEVGIEDIKRASKLLPIVSVQNQYNLGFRKWESVLDYTAENNIAFIPWYPLASGPDSLQGKIKHLADKYQATTAQVALAWLLHRSPNILLIPGTGSVGHLDENLASRHIELSEEDIASLGN